MFLVVLAVPGLPPEASFCICKSFLTVASDILLLVIGFPSLREELTLLEFLDWTLCCFTCLPGDWTLLLSWLSFFRVYRAFKSWYRSGFTCIDLFYLDAVLVAVGVVVDM